MSFSPDTAAIHRRAGALAGKVPKRTAKIAPRAPR